MYPNASGEDFVEYQSLINIRPRAGNKGMEIEDRHIRDQVKNVISLLVQ